MKRPLLREDGTIRFSTYGMATLSSDARVICQTTAAAFLQEFTKCMNDPELMII